RRPPRRTLFPYTTLFRSGQRPPFSGNGHTPAPWLGEWSDESRPDGVCPLLSLVRQGYRKRRVYSVSTAHGELLGGDRTPESAMRSEERRGGKGWRCGGGG